MLYGRWTVSYFDPAKKDAMVSHLTPQLDAITKEVAGAVQARVVQVAENRMVVHAIFENKEAADAASKMPPRASTSLFGRLVQRLCG